MSSYLAEGERERSHAADISATDKASRSHETANRASEADNGPTHNFVYDDFTSRKSDPVSAQQARVGRGDSKLWRCWHVSPCLRELARMFTSCNWQIAKLILGLAHAVHSSA